MKAAIVIAKNTFRELIRDRILYLILVFAVLLVFLSVVLGQLSYAEQMRITLDLGLAGVELSVLILSIFIGGTLVFRELEKRTVLTLLTRPLTRGQFLFGKFLGLFSIIFTGLICLGLVLLLVLCGIGWKYQYQFPLILLGFLYQGAVLISITMVFGNIVRPVLSIALTIGVFLIGRSMDSLLYFAEKSQSVVFEKFAWTVQYLFPNFERFNWKGFAGQESFLSIGDLFLSSFYFLIWITILQSAANLLFRRKEFV